MRPLKVSIVIPTYSRPNLLDRLLASIVRQTFRDYEVIVINDASPDAREYFKVINKFKKIIRRFQYSCEKINHGAPFCRNRGIEKSKYPLISLVDDDDEWMPEKLEKQVNVFENHWKDYDMVYTWLVIKDENNRVLSKLKPSIKGKGVHRFLKDISVNFPNPSATLIKRECFTNAGLFNEKLPGCQDWDMWIRIINKGYRCYPIKEFLTIQHLQKNRISSSFGAKKGFLLLGVNHFWLFLKTNPAVFLHLVWLTIGLKLGLRKKIEKYF